MKSRFLTLLVFSAMVQSADLVSAEGNAITDETSKGGESLSFRLGSSNCVLFSSSGNRLTADQTSKILRSETLIRKFLLERDKKLWTRLSEHYKEQLRTLRLEKLFVERPNHVDENRYSTEGGYFSSSGQGVKFIVLNFEKYFRQYTIYGDHISVNFLLSDRLGGLDLLEEETVVFDGGPAYFKIGVDLTSEEIQSLYINGFG